MDGSGILNAARKTHFDCETVCNLLFNFIILQFYYKTSKYRIRYIYLFNDYRLRNVKCA